MEHNLKQTKKFQTSIIVLLLSFIITSCVSNVEEQLEEIIDTDAKISYRNTVQPIIDARCLSCHASGGNFPDISSYSKVKAHAVSIKEEVASGRMPKGGPLTTAQIKSIVDWVDEGALDN